ncbi:MAG: hypothetical protein UY28_C0004G0056 [Candidatus Amesbacteria bacterium GW2011_GWB1_48_13]|uniref:Uncharacterized protein n=1 Tax=Candidatus Amesbacteria bacterium GW2011_GWB1_48_13 TaxID=1618362 RepID=A0A0G1X6S5_9BACT|nr:MAG: hypothetical protein UY28_C0004G0056 [Candidatus Amesbacteria bacterium GW2011_GWB1_48_13]
MEKVYVEKFVTFSYISMQGWSAYYWDSPPSGMQYYRLKIPVPEELVGQTIEPEMSGPEIKID